MTGMTTEAAPRYVGSAIKEYIRENGPTAKIIAKKLNEREHLVYRLLDGTYSTTLMNEEHVQRVADVLRVDWETRSYWLQLVRDFDAAVPRKRAWND